MQWAEWVIQGIDNEERDVDAIQVSAWRPVFQVAVHIFIAKHWQHHSLSNFMQISRLGVNKDESIHSSLNRNQNFNQTFKIFQLLLLQRSIA